MSNPTPGSSVLASSWRTLVTSKLAAALHMIQESLPISHLATAEAQGNREGTRLEPFSTLRLETRRIDAA